MTEEIAKRKQDHLALCASGDVGFRTRGHLLDQVKLVHQSLPDLHLDEIDLHVNLLGKRLSAPLVIAGMTGGTDEAAAINRDLAAVAEARGYAFGLGSQRAMLRDPKKRWTYDVRDVAPTTLVMGNIGVVQARDMSCSELNILVRTMGLDALCVHMNPAMELIQSGGDRDFRGGCETFARLARDLSVPVVAKETGCGISPQSAQKLLQVGVLHVDVSGAGGTSWVGVETMRAEEEGKALGEQLWDWGIPTAASVFWCVRSGLYTIATGGIRHGLDAAAALALGAKAVGFARPVLKAYKRGGREAVDLFFEEVERELRAVMLLCGADNVEALAKSPRVITGELNDWLKV